MVPWFVCAGASFAGEADVVDATARPMADGRWSFSVTVRHADAGWDHYADRWEVLSPEGDVLATRVLLHPHENEQPFTRGLSGIALPAGTTKVILRAHDSVHGFGGADFPLDLDPDRTGG
ncbi:hypothetical protein [Breoghania sp. L-A4]|uniref:hypothetical protein n=1 Tax=Breoghania sp. L-A4 TaxID=2304600 RepID=UPI000E35E766|nr:hypothetical protein [Breoghania sp. L-A4]AXS42572.1 hypothetical protein D1F64_11400 [Breoghania sp. L-A4]